MTSLVQYERARAALAEATRIDEVLPVREAMEHVKLHARHVQDRALLADATEIQIRAERRLGELLREAETEGLLRVGRPKKSTVTAENPTWTEGFTLKEIGVSHKLSSTSQQKASLSERALEAMIRGVRDRIVSGRARIIEPDAVNGARSVMSSRQEPDDSLDYFPTPPWATRALIEVVLPHIGVTRLGQVWEPACGEGHMSGVLEEYPDRIDTVVASDIHDYTVDGRMPPAWWRTLDFLDPEAAEDGTPAVHWIITNPPFGDKAIDFVLRGLDLAHVGVAMFFRTQWAVEGVERYERLFQKNPPTLFAPFVERVPLAKGRYDPDGTTATAYCWLVWATGEEPRAPLWIPPGQRKNLELGDDVERFTAQPVISCTLPGANSPAESYAASIDAIPETVFASTYPSSAESESGGGAGVTPREAPPGEGVEPPSPSPEPDLDIPDSLRRVAMTEDEAALIASDLESNLVSLNDHLFVRKLRDNPAGMTALDRKWLAKIAAKQSEAA